MFGLFSKKISPEQCQIHPVLLLVLDGFGIAPPGPGNAVYLAGMPNWTRFLQEYPHGQLVASGESVGLPTVEVGNTEVGHLTMGAGKVMYQDLKRISMALEDATFPNNEAFTQVIAHVAKSRSVLHLMGLVGKGSVHSDLGHLYGLIELCEHTQTPFVLHAFTDGRDSSPTSGKDVLAMVEQRIAQSGLGFIGSVAGRYYAMDRDRRWERTEKSYQLLTSGQGDQAPSVTELMERCYAANITDEFIPPTLITSSKGAQSWPLAADRARPSLILDNDGVIFFNFRKDRPKQLTMAFVMPEFETLKAKEKVIQSETVGNPVEAAFTTTFKRDKKPQNLFFVTMTEYDETLPVSAVAYPPEKVAQPLSYELAKAGIVQLRMAESEKQRFVTYYFDGLREDQPNNTDIVIIPSPKVATYDKKPEMSVHLLAKEFSKRISQCRYQFAMMNFANPDMVGHTGSIPAAVEALNHVDQVLGQLETLMLQYDGTIVITADHGNCEEMLDFPKDSFFYTSDQGKVNTKHSGNLVPVVMINKSWKGKPADLGKGGLRDIAPTIMALFGLSPAKDMTGRNLLRLLSEKLQLKVATSTTEL